MAPGRFAFLDGLRGLAALYVVYFHIAARFAGPHGSDLLNHFSAPLKYAHFAVSLFIVISGFCLVLPVAASAEGVLPGGTWGFLKRRARRLLPPYYVALLLSILIIAASQARRQVSGEGAGPRMAALAADHIGSHLLLVHNLREDWSQSINAPLWSVATEAQIYVVFALVLVPVRRRFGTPLAVVSAIALGLAPSLLPRGLNIPQACPWFLGLFALGMAAGEVAVSSDGSKARQVRWARIAATFGVLLVAHCSLSPLGTDAWRLRGIELHDLLLGCGAASLLAWSATADAAKRPMLLRMLESRILVVLGAFSYSLYLIHVPVQDLMVYAMQRLAISGPVQHWAMLLAGPPVCLAAAYAFFLAVERRFISSRTATPSVG